MLKLELIKMWNIVVYFSVLAIAGFCAAQVHYIPAQYIIPALNTSNFYPFYTNHSLHINNQTGFYNSNNNGSLLLSNRTEYNNWQINNGTNGTHSNRDGNLVLGRIGPQDRLLFNQVYLKTSRWWTTREKIIDYPKDVPGGYVRHETISAIKIYNQFYDGNSATARILKGGVGSKFVRIELASKWGKGFKYVVQIFGH